MGGCISRGAAAEATAATVKLVLPDGGLREYSRSVTAAYALGKADTACFFVCNADEMEFDGLVSALGPEEELRQGQLYFVLPRKMLKRALRAEDLAALAVKASAALASTGRRRGRGAVVPLVFPVEEEVEAGHRRSEEKRRKPRRGGGRGSKFSPELIAIPE